MSAGVDSECDSEGYRHEALFYSDLQGFIDGTLPFVREAVAAAEPILVALGPEKLELLRAELNGAAERVLFADMAAIGTNPARLIPAWQDFVAENAPSGRRLRGVGEPISPERTPAELSECQRHEALLNVAFADQDLWLLCPYDAGALAPEVIERARRNHPYVSDGHVACTSDSFPGREQLAAPFDEPLSPRPARALRHPITGALSLRDIRGFVTRHAVESGLSGLDTSDLVFAVNEVAANSVTHGGGAGELYLWRDGDAVVCEVRDRGRIDDPLIGRKRPAPDSLNGRGLWMANQLCELVQIRSLAEGVVVRVHKRIS